MTLMDAYHTVANYVPWYEDPKVIGLIGISLILLGILINQIKKRKDK